MRVVAKSNPTAKLVKRAYQDGRPPKYRAFPPSDNKVDSEKQFETETELARFILANNGWKSYFWDISSDQRNQYVAEVK